MCCIYIDADSSGNVKQIESVAKEFGIPVILYCNGDHIIDSDYSEVRYVEKGRDIADFAIINHCKSGDIVITKDYGLATMALAKDAKCLTPGGAQYTNMNIDKLLYRRHLARRTRHRGKTPDIRIPGFRNIGIEKALKKNIAFASC